MPLSHAELEDLRRAKRLLEHPGLAVRLTSLLGRPIEGGLALLPKGAAKLVHAATTKTLRGALRVAVGTLGREARPPARLRHKLLAIGSGAAGGFFGLPALALELRSQGEDLSRPEARLACVEVFAFGGPRKSDDAAETGYFAVRSALVFAIEEAAQFIAQKGFVEEGAPVIVRLAGQIAARFSVTVSEKFAAQALPILGALGGASVNAVFIGHFQDMATGHFTVRRLERAHGADEVRRAYAEIA